MKNSWPAALLACIVLCLFGMSFQSEFASYNEELAGTQMYIRMIPISGGSFQAGSPDNEPGRSYDEGPLHEVRVGDFWMSEVEITWDQYEIFLYREMDGAEHSNKGEFALAVDGVSGATMPYVNFNLPGHPVTNVTQYAASTFCEWLTAKTGRYYRLPTEAEWEYACRTGNASAFSFGDDPLELADFAWYADNSGETFKPVGSKQPNSWGLYDMHGNAAEWVLDVYDSTSYQWFTSTISDPLITDDVLYPHVFRGGSWKAAPDKLRCASRQYSYPALKKRDPQFPKSLWWLTDAGHIGFRIVRPRKVPENPDVYRIKPIEEY